MTNDLRRGWLAAVAWASMSVVGAEEAPAPARVVVPLEVLPSKHVAVQVRINGEGPFRLIFDTGAPITLVSPRAGRKAGITAGGGAGLFALGGQTSAKAFAIGDARAADVPVLVMDHPAVDMLAAVSGGELDGIVGFTFFGRFETTIDYQASTLSFAPRDYVPEDFLQKLPDVLAGGGGRRVRPRAGLLGFTLRADGPVVEAVSPGGAAEAAGLKAGDRFTLLDGRWIENVADLHLALPLLPPGEAAPCTVVRDGRELAVTLVPRRGL